MEKQTTMGEWQVKERNPVVWYEQSKPRRGEELLKNLAVASSLVVCAIVLKTGALPAANDMTDAVLTAVSDDSLLDESLGKLSFVSSLFPQATLVFGENDDQPLAMPVSGGVVVHVWSPSEPYTTWRSNGSEVFSSCAGVVMGVYHGNGEELLIQVMSDDGLSCLYGNMAETTVKTGDHVEEGEVLGRLLEEQECVFELRQDGVCIDPAIRLKTV